MGINIGDIVSVDKNNLRAYVYRGKGSKFKVVKKLYDGYGNCFNIEDEQGELVFNVIEQDINLKR